MSATGCNRSQARHIDRPLVTVCNAFGLATYARPVDSGLKSPWEQGMDSRSPDDDANEAFLPRHARPSFLNKQLDPLDKPARPLGAKRSALQMRRHRHSIAAWQAGLASSARNGEACVIASTDGTLAFAVTRTPRGMLIERRHWPAVGPRFAQTLSFHDASDFDRWCASEPVRFDDPKLYALLCRHGHEVLDNER